MINYILVPSIEKKQKEKKRDNMKRVNAIWALNNGMSVREVAKQFGVSGTTVKTWRKEYKESGQVLSGKKLGRPRDTNREIHEAIAELYRQHPQLTSEEVEAALEIKVSRRSILRISNQFGLRCSDQGVRNVRKKYFKQRKQKDAAKPFTFCIMDLLD